MKLLLRTAGSPVPQAVTADGEGTLGGLLKQLLDSGKLGECDKEPRSLRLVHHGRVLRERGAKLADLCSDGDVLVVLPGRAVVRPEPAAAPASRGPSMREINAAIREDLAAQGPGTLAAAEAEAAAQAAARPPLPPGPGSALEQALLTGEMGALRAYLEQLSEALRGADGAPGGGGGDDVAGLPLAAALDAFLGLPLPAQGGAQGNAGGGAAAAAGARAAGGGGHVDGGEGEAEEEEYLTEEEEEDEEDEEDGEGGSDEEGHEFSDEEGEGEGEGYTDDEEEEEGEEGEEGEQAQEAHGHQGQLLPPQVPELDSVALAGLVEMGFPESLCRNALLMGRNRFEPALEWLLGHAEDPAAAEPLSDAQLARLYGRGPRRQGAAVDAGHLSHLVDMGFDPAQAEQALRAFHNSLPAAASWLLGIGTAATAAGALPGGSASRAAPAAAAAAEADPAAASSSSGGRQQQEGQQREQASEAGWASSGGNESIGRGGGQAREGEEEADDGDEGAPPSMISDSGSDGEGEQPAGTGGAGGDEAQPGLESEGCSGSEWETEEEGDVGQEQTGGTGAAAVGGGGS